MKEKKVKISLTGLIFLILLIAVIVGSSIFFFRNYDLEIKSKKELEQVTQTNDKEEKEEAKIEELDKDSELVKELYNIILKSDSSDNCFAWQSGFEPASCYRDIKTTFNTLTDMEKTLIILQNYNENEINNLTKSEFQKISKETIEMEFIHDTVKEYKNLNEKALEIFNQENIKWNNYGGLASELQYIDNSYYLVGFDGGGKGTSEYGYAEIQKVEKDAENIYIYDKFIYVDSTNYDLTEGDSKIHIYTSADKSKDIGTESDIMLSVKELYKKYENQLETYVHTFKQKKDGSYYWVSSEIYEIADINNQEDVYEEITATTFKLGNYTVEDVKYDEGGVSNEECGIKLKENNKFEIYMGWGTWFSGNYEVENNKLICEANIKEWDGGPGAGSRNTNILFTFDIINDNKLKLIKIEDNDLENENQVYEDALSIGMTYTIK